MEVVTLKPSPKYRQKLYLGTALLGIIIVASCAFFAYLIGLDVGGVEGATRGILYSILINLVWLIPAFLIISPYYRSLSYEVHKHEIIVRVGVITHSVKHVPFRTVTNVRVTEDPLDRIFGLGVVNIQTAGLSGKSSPEESLVGLPNFNEVYNRVASQLRSFRSAMSPAQVSEEDHALPGETFEDILLEVRMIRSLLDKD